MLSAYYDKKGLSSVEKISSISRSRLSTIDRTNNLKQSTIDLHTTKLREQLKDETLGKGFVATVLKRLGEGEVNSIANYAERKGHHPGKLFVSICYKSIQEKKL